jgi:HD superfamily phosphohydrolase
MSIVIDNIEKYLKSYKIINDNIHGNIILSKLATIIIDSPEFQRLRYIKQLSTCYFVYPNAVHTRFEHSLGTYHICKKLLYNLKKNSSVEEINVIRNIPELINRINIDNILDDYIIELVCIGALCHDLGHGPFSHLFDDVFLKNKIHTSYKYHEYRSCKLLEQIIKKNVILKNIFSLDDIKFISDIINPGPNNNYWIYQIVSNNVNNIDIDKFDYLTRDSKMLNIKISFDFTRLLDNSIIINNNICYAKKVDSDIINLFQTRYYLHKKVYSHKIVISSLLLITELLEIFNKITNFTDSVNVETDNNLDEFIQYTDDYILNVCRYISNHNITEESLKLNKILDKIDNHNFYKLIYSKTYDFIEDINFDKEIQNFNNNKYIKFESIIGYISGKKSNPLDSVYLYNPKNHNFIELLTKSDSNTLLPHKYQEKIVMIFEK